LGVSSHGIGFVQNNDLAVEVTLDWSSGLSETLDHVSDNLDSSSIGSIELKMFRHIRGKLTSRTIMLYSFPYISLAQAIMVDVLPVPGGP
jgi:hypothetical protein